MKSLDELLEQHGYYDLGNRLSITKRRGLWLIYFDGMEIHSRVNRGDTQRFATVRQALLYLESKPGIAVLDKLLARPHRPAEAGGSGVG